MGPRSTGVAGGPGASARAAPVAPAIRAPAQPPAVDTVGWGKVRVSAHRGPRQPRRRPNAANEVVAREQRFVPACVWLRGREAAACMQVSGASAAREWRASCRGPRWAETRHLFQKQMRRPAGWAGARIAGATGAARAEVPGPPAQPVERGPMASARRSSKLRSTRISAPFRPDTDARQAGEPSPGPPCRQGHARTERPPRSGGQTSAAGNH